MRYTQYALLIFKIHFRNQKYMINRDKNGHRYAERGKEREREREIERDR